MIPLATIEEMRKTDARAAELGVSTETLMENSGRAVADAICSRRAVAGARIVVLAGKGNNGGDGLVAARILRDMGAAVEVFLMDDGSLFSPAAREASVRADILVDAILGTGSRMPLSEELSEIVRNIASLREKHPRPLIVSIDIPTGRSADSGVAPGPCVRPDLTVTLAAMKPGLLLEAGAAEAGEVVCVPIGLPAEAMTQLDSAVFERTDIAPNIPLRARSAHKGDARLLILGGAVGMSGAVVLAAEGALAIGVGYLHIAGPATNLPVFAASLPEAVKIPLPDEEGRIAGSTPQLIEVAGHARALVIGPGLGRGGTNDPRISVLREVLAAAKGPVLLDGDALFALAEDRRIRLLIKVTTVLTPHAAEAARLLGTTVREIEERRFDAACEIAEKYDAVVLLKGRPTVAARPRKSAKSPRRIVVPFGNERLATGGAGDVLSGVIGALLARGGDPFLSAATAAALHGIAAEEAPHAPLGLRMRDLAREITRVAAEALQGSQTR